MPTNIISEHNAVTTKHRYPQLNSNHPSASMDMHVIANAGNFENVAKMGRLAPGMNTQQNDLPKHSQVRLRTVKYVPPTEEPPSSNRSIAGSESGRGIPRPQHNYREDVYSPDRGRGDDGKKIFYRNPFPPGSRVEDVSNPDDIASQERLMNKIRQREKLRHLGADFSGDPRKENCRRKIYTRRERDQMRNRHTYSDHGSINIESDIEDFYRRSNNNWHMHQRSGYSTPGGYSGHTTSTVTNKTSEKGSMINLKSADEMKLGRSMRAAPRRLAESSDGIRSAPAARKEKHDYSLIQPLLSVDTNRPTDAVTEYYQTAHIPDTVTSTPYKAPSVGAISSPQHPTQDLIEMLNRQQRLLSQQREQRKQFLDEQTVKEKAQQIVNQSYLKDEIDALNRRESDIRESKQLLNDAFSLANGRENINVDTKYEMGMMSPKSDISEKDFFDKTGRSDRSGMQTPSAMDMILTEGKVTHLSARDGSQSEQPLHTDDKDASKSTNEQLELGETLGGDKEKLMQAVHDELQRLSTS
ncbi:hypothetical protein KUTeg_023540 [Tegillarca granosa]|uniref:Uncharacterized protein n=1 Tax=Tegillarca granosa TaxID=220873 RepID=A0ABQ9E2X1_TEGGR|nr:hypothetical protein KUTeg_023540 [Tegillarca granosa]